MEATTINDYPNIEDEEWRLHMARTRTHQPKGGMCASCVHQSRKCDHLSFESMPVIANLGTTKIVKCTEYLRGELNG